MFDADQCPLCGRPNALPRPSVGPFFHCAACDLIFRNPNFFLGPQEEKARYLLHKNNVLDPKYQEFVKPLVSGIQQRFPVGSRGLDFGAGTGPVAAYLLRESGYEVDLYDPFFWPRDLFSASSKPYDFVLACEVVEHFHAPAKEFATIRSCLKPSGLLAMMTLLHSAQTQLDSWHYFKDPTHVVFYSKQTMNWLTQRFNFGETVVSGGRLILMQPSSLMNFQTK